VVVSISGYLTGTASNGDDVQLSRQGVIHPVPLLGVEVLRMQVDE
jgi:hypothetical protein